MQYYNPEDKASKRLAAIAVLIYFVVFLLLMFLVRFTKEEVDPATEGILVEFGETDFGAGHRELAATDVAATPPAPQNQDADELLETDDSQDITVEQERVDTPQKNPTPQVEQPVQQRDTLVAEVRVVNQQALFPGRSQQGTALSQGDTEIRGNQGAPSGGDSGATIGGGDDGINAMAVLKDRSVVGQLPKPAYRADISGRVIIDIVVNDVGEVTSAAYRAQGSTTNSSQLVTAAQEAALKAKFTESDNFVQGGTITYDFKMN